MKAATPFAQRLNRILASRKFFWFTIGLLVVQALWIALSSQYPMAFDEDFHLGIIRLYANHLSPFWSSQPAGADIFGAVGRDPSYIYQYLMSFPYRLLRLFTSNQTFIVIVLRILNIALFASALPLYRRLLLKIKASPAIVNLSLLIFVLLPVVPLLAAQINYDNLFLPIVAATLLLTLSIKDQLTRQIVPIERLLLLLTVGLFGSLVKYAFLPIFAAAAVYLCFYLYNGRKHGALQTTAKQITSQKLLVLAVPLIILSVLCVERYGVNLVRYHAPVPECNQVLTIQQCSAYGPWNRDYNLALNKPAQHTSSPINFVGEWFYGMWLRTYFAVAGPSIQFQTRGPLPVPSISGVAFLILGASAALLSFRTLLQKYDRSVAVLFGLVTAFYVGSLVLQEHKAYVRTGQAVAINGRYLFPVILFVIVIAALGLKEVLGKHNSLKTGIAILAIVGSIWGGGVLTYILRSNDAWYWPNNSAVQHANHAVQKTIGPLTPGYKKPTAFLR